MSTRRRRASINLASEDGIYIVFLLFGIVAFFGVIGLAADSSKMYIESLRQQLASDAAAVGAAAMIGQAPLGPVLTDADRSDR